MPSKKRARDDTAASRPSNKRARVEDPSAVLVPIPQLGASEEKIQNGAVQTSDSSRAVSEEEQIAHASEDGNEELGRVKNTDGVEDADKIEKVSEIEGAEDGTGKGARNRVRTAASKRAKKAREKARKASQSAADLVAAVKVPAPAEPRQQRDGQPIADKQSDLKPVSADRLSKRLVDRPTKWVLTPPTAGRFIDHEPLFVTDPSGEQYLLAATAREVQVLSVNTSLVERLLQLPQKVEAQCWTLGAVDSKLLHIAYSDGVVGQWDWTSGKMLDNHTWSTRGNIVAMRAAAVQDRNLLFFINQTDQHHYAICVGKQILFTTEQPIRQLRVFPEAGYLIATGPSAVVFGRLTSHGEDQPKYQWTELPLSSAITCMDCRQNACPSKSRPTVSLALGIAEGQIHLYDDVSSLVDSAASLTAPRILHWHRERVSAIAFSQDGNYIISGGRETVLVLWQLETGRKQYLPHLTSEIDHIVVSPEGDRYALQMGDNSIMVLSTSELKPVANFAGLQLSGHRQTAFREQLTGAAAVLHPLDSHQILLTVPATANEQTRPFLQTFDARTSRHITRQALTRNNVTDFNLGPEKTPLVSPDVAHLAISHDGQWLATSDEWMPPATDLQHVASSHHRSDIDVERHKRREVHLKFWHWDGSQNLWTLTTRVDTPHDRTDRSALGAGKVFKLASDPRSTGFATIGEDGIVRLWRTKARLRHGVVLQSGGQHVDVFEWFCRRTIKLPTQPNRADSPLGGGGDVRDAEDPGEPLQACLTFSQDGSVLAASTVWAGTCEAAIVHFIDVSSGEITATRSFGSSSRLTDLAFQNRYLLSVSLDAVEVWDVIDELLHHRHKLSKTSDSEPIPPMLAVNLSDNSFAVASGGSDVKVYRTSEREPVYQHEMPSPVASLLAGGRGYMVICADASIRTLLPHGGVSTQRTLPLPIIDGDAASIGVAEADSTRIDVPDLVTSVAQQTPGKAASLLVEDGEEDDRAVVRPEALAAIFDVGQSFALPPVRDMFQAVVGLFARKPVVDMVL